MTLQKSDLKILKFFWHFRQATLQILLTLQRSGSSETCQSVRFFWLFRGVSDSFDTFLHFREVSDSSKFSEKWSILQKVFFSHFREVSKDSDSFKFLHFREVSDFCDTSEKWLTLQRSDWHFRAYSRSVRRQLRILMTLQRSVRFFWHFSTLQRSVRFFWHFRKVTDTSEHPGALWPGHLARNSDSTSIHYCEIWKLKKPFIIKFHDQFRQSELFLTQIPRTDVWSVLSEKETGPDLGWLVNFTPDKHIIWVEISTWSKDWNCTQKLENIKWGSPSSHSRFSGTRRLNFNDVV